MRPSLSKIAQNIYFYRLCAGMTQQQVADRAGLSLATINKIERALVYPRPNTLSKLAAALGVTPADLLRGEGDK